MKENLWCCVGTNTNREYYDFYTLAYTRKDSIKKRMENMGRLTWTHIRKKYGWKCIKVKMILEPA